MCALIVLVLLNVFNFLANYIIKEIVMEQC